MRNVALLLALVSAPASAQNLDLLHQVIDIDLTAAPVTTVHLVIDLEILGPSTTLDLLIPPGTISELLVDGVVTAARPHPQGPSLAIQVPFASEKQAGERVRVEMTSSGAISCRRAGSTECFRTAMLTVFPPAAPAAAWHALNLWWSDAFTAEVQVRVPAGQKVITGQGEPRSVTALADGTERWVFDASTAVVGLELVAGAFEKIDAPNAARASAYYLPGAVDTAKLAQAVDLAASLLPVYDRLFGAAPIDRVRLIAVPRGLPFGGIGLLGTVLFGDYVFGELDYLLVQGTAHELAHTWWGNMTGAGDSAEAGFFNESFAEYSAWRGLGELQGPAVRTGGVRMNAVWYMYRRPEDRDIAILDPAIEDSDLFVWVTYHKASVALRALETRTGTAAFDRVLKRMVQLGVSNVTSDRFITALSEESGRDLSAEAGGWLRGVGFPHLTASAEIIGSEVVVRVSNDGAQTMLLPVRLTDASGRTTEGTVDIAAGTVEARIAFTGARPVLVELDPTWTAPREIIPEVVGDVTFDGEVDALDLIEVALRHGGDLATERRKDGGYDPLYDIDGDRRIGGADLAAISLR